MPNTSNDDVIIVGSLSDKELRDSIDKLVDYVGDKTTIMAGKFDVAMEKMKSAMKDFAITQKVSVDLMQDAWKKMSVSFDAMLKAQQNATSSGNNSGTGGGTGGSAYAPNTVGALEESIKAEQRKRKEMELTDAALQSQNDKIARQKDLLDSVTRDSAKRFDLMFNRKYGEAMKIDTGNLAEAERKLNRLKDLAHFLNVQGITAGEKVEKVNSAIARTERAIARLKEKSPKTLKDVLGMDENSVDAIARKMAALKRVSVDPQNIAQVKQLGNEYQRLSRLQSELLGKNVQLTHSNNYLAQSFGYIRNRIVYAMTLGAATSLVKQVYDIRSQYELLERSLGVLVNSFERGSQIFRELNSMALKSPFTLMELAGAAKQLTAYNFEANEVVNTTRRLADLSAALGVPMERLTYNLGQIRAQTVLTARDARDFANAGLPIVSSLADYFTELEGKVVSTGDVYDRMSKKMVSYSDVMAVLNKMTDEGGKFFDFQAKQAETLRVQLANLTLAWNNMLNEIGEANQGILTAPISLLKSLFQHWQSISRIITEVVVGLGAYKAAQMIVTATIGTTAKVLDATILRNKKAIAAELERKAITERLTVSELRLIATQNQVTAADYRNALSTKNLTKEKALFLVALNRNNVALQQALIRMGLLTAAEVRSMTAGRALKLVMDLLGLSIKRTGMAIGSFFVKNAWLIAISALIEVFMAYKNSAEQVAEINKNVANSAKESFESITEYLNNYSNVLDRLYKQRKSDSEGNIDMTRTDIPEEEATKAWEAMRKKIIESTAASNSFLTTLEAEADMSERLRQGFNILTELQSVESVLRDMKDDAIDISTTDLWGLAGEGLSDDLKDFIDIFDKYNQLTESARQGTRGESVFNEMKSDLEELNAEIQVTAASLAKFTQDKNFSAIGQREAFEKTIQSIADKEQLSVRETRILRIKSEEEYYAAAKTLLEQQIANSVGQNKIALQERLKDLETEFNANKTIQETFFTWLQEHQQSEVQRRFGDMTKEEIAHIDWSKKEWEQWAEKLARDFSNEYGTSFNDLSNLVKKANTWSINIPVYFNTVGKEVSDIVEDYEKRTGKRANSEIQNTKTQLEIIESLRDQQSKLEKQITAAEKAGGSYWEKNKEKLNEQNQDLISQIHAYNALTKAEEDAQKKKNQRKRKPEEEVAEALRTEMSIIKEIQSNYDKLRKAGVSNMDAIDLASKGYEATIIRINQVLSKFGIDKFNAANFAGKDVRSLLQSLEEQRKALLASGKVKTSSLQALDVEIQKLTVDAKTYDMKKVTDELNNELNKIKDEYELAVELDANPELGDMFTDMFNVDTSTLPQTFGEAYQRAVEASQKQLAKLKEYTNANFKPEDFDLMKANFKPDKNGQWFGIDINSEVIQNLIKAQKTWRDMYQKNLVDTENMLDDYVKKYGDYSDKIAEIERDRIEKMRKLNEAYYTEQMRNTPEYKRKKAAINNAAEQQKSQAEWDNFTNTRLYIELFENLELASTGALMAMKEKLGDVRDSMKNLKPEQLKQITAQYMKLEKELMSRNPFKGVIKHAKDYMKAVGKTGKQAQKDFIAAQRNYDAQEKVVSALKEQYEQKKAQEPTNTKAVEALAQQLGLEEDKLAKLKEILNAADKEAQKYNMMTKLFKEQANEIAALLQAIGQNLQSLADLRDNLQSTFGFEFSDSINGAIDGLARMGKGISGTVSSAQSGDVFGILNGVVDVFAGIGDGIASLFGDGSARTKRLNHEINESKEVVRQLTMAYDDLERAINKSLGTGETEARRLAIANKEAQLAELERQKELEQSKRSKDRDDDAINQYEESIHSLRNEIDDLKEDVINNLWGEDVKSAAEAFVDAWVQAWRAGETTLDAIQEKMDEMIYNLIKKAMTSKIVETLLHPVYDELNKMTKEGSEGGVALTTNELRLLAQQAGITAEQINVALGEFYGNLEQLGIVSKTNDESKELSALQQGIQGVTEDTAGAIEAYMNIVAQRVFEQNLYLQEIRDHLNNFDLDVQLGTLSQMLLQLQQSYQVQQNIESILTGVLNPSGRAIVVELNS